METATTHSMFDAMPSFVPGDPTRGQLWKQRLTLVVIDHALTHEEAQAHLTITQQIGCVIREEKRGPRGGRGKMQYNASIEWPQSWIDARYHSYWVVVGIGDRKTARRIGGTERIEQQMKTQLKIANLAQGYGAGKTAIMEHTRAHLAAISTGTGMYTSIVFDEAAKL
jgi:hypothetical protein